MSFVSRSYHTPHFLKEREIWVSHGMFMPGMVKREIEGEKSCWACKSNSHFPRPAPVWPCSSVGGATVIKPEGRGFKSHPGQSFPLSLCGPISMLMQRNPSLSLSINTASWLLTLSKIAIVNSEVTGAKLVTLRGYFRNLFWSVKMRNPE